MIYEDILSQSEDRILSSHITNKDIKYNIKHFHIYAVVKMVCLWKSHNLDIRALGTFHEDD